MIKKPDALQYAEFLEGGSRREGDLQIAKELRRLHNDNKKLEEENGKIWAWLVDAEQHLAVLKGIRVRGSDGIS